MEAGFGLEPLAGEAGGGEDSRRGVDAAEGGVGEVGRWSLGKRCVKSRTLRSLESSD